MKALAAVSVLVVLAVLSSSAAARDWVPFVEAPAGAEASARVTSSDASGTSIEIEVPGMFIEHGSGAVVIAVPGAVGMQHPGRPDLPVLSYFVAVPDRGRVELEVVSVDERVLPGYDVSPAAPFQVQGKDAEPAVAHAGTYSTDALYPSQVAELGVPGIMRDLRIVQVSVYPVRYNPVTREIVASDRVEIRLNVTADQGINEKSVQRSYRSETFEPLYKSFVLNYESLPRAQVRRGSYLIIAHDTFVSSMAQLVLWKQQRGIETELVPLSTIGTNPSNQDIKDYIQDYYETADPAPDYVMLVGDTWGAWGFFPSWYTYSSTGPSNNVTDHPYEELEGDDYFPDVLLGRFSIDTATEAIVASLKVLSYERDCDAGNDDWYERALMVAGNYGDEVAHVTSPRQTTLRVREIMLEHGYAQVDTVFYPPYVEPPHPIPDVINNGVGFVNYRGWGAASGWHFPEFYVDDVTALSNGKMLPVMTSVVCGTGNFDSWGFDPAFCEAWIRSGSPGNLRGGPAVISPSDFDTHTKWNNALDIGIYDGIFKEDLMQVGQAALRGKIEVLRNFPRYAHPDSLFGAKFYFDIYNIVGDPELHMRTMAPATFDVSHDATIPLGAGVLLVEVLDGMGEVVPGAEVVVWKPDESYEVRKLEGGRTIDMPLRATTVGQAYVTVYKDNYKPYTGTVNVVLEDKYVGWYSHAIDDDNSGGSSGNGDGVPNPGETIELTVTLRNYGTLLATGVDCRLGHPTTGQLVSYGDIAAGATSSGAGPYTVSIPAGTPNGTELVYGLYASGGTNDTWDSELRLVVGAPLLEYFSLTVNDGGDGVLDPGETATVEISLANYGEIDATSIAGTLLMPATGLTAGDDSGTWGTVPAEGIQANSGDTFTLTAASDVAIGHEFTLVVNLTGDDGLSQYVLFPFVVGTPTTSAPFGPDAYGYYCYDDTDTAYDEAPTYSWIEIDPSYGGSGTDLGLTYESIVDVSLPFTFQYYGEFFNEIAICSNGDVGLGGAPYWEHQPRNTIIPCGLGPDAMIAPFWDDLNPSTAGKVLTKDMGDGRFIVEWSRVAAQYDETGTMLQTFELVLFDQDVYSTSTGDGEILFQYETICNCDNVDTLETHNYSTVGIENPPQSDGVLYTFYGVYPDEAAELADGRAIKFTTDPPDAYPSTDIIEDSDPIGVVLQPNRPNPFNPITTISFGMPAMGHAELSVFDVSGRLVTTLYEGEAEPGFHHVTWNGENSNGEKVASGVYFSRLTALGEERSHKMILLK